MTEYEVPPRTAAIRVDIVFGRRILAPLLTTYLPTVLICIVSFSTNYFKAFFFEVCVFSRSRGNYSTYVMCKYTIHNVLGHRDCELDFASGFDDHVHQCDRQPSKDGLHQNDRHLAAIQPGIEHTTNI